MVLALCEGRLLALEFVYSVSMESMIISILQPTDTSTLAYELYGYANSMSVALALTPLATIQDNNV
jgi:hypothetical protein